MKATFISARLSDQEARGYVRRFNYLGCVRADVFNVGFGFAVVEIRPLWGEPQRPCVSLRSAAECEAYLAQVEAQS